MGASDSNLSGDIALVPGITDSKSLSRNEVGCRRLIAISVEASPIESGSTSCRDSIFAPARSGRHEELLSVLRIVLKCFPAAWVAVSSSSCRLSPSSAAGASVNYSASGDR